MSGLRNTAPKVALVIGLLGVFLTFGLPRWLAGDDPSVGSHSAATFAKVCREHGGTPSAAPEAGAGSAQQRCTVRYGAHVYLMDAITPNGFDEDTARFQRQGCDEAGREERASAAPGHRARTFVYHPDTGVCERRP